MGGKREGGWMESNRRWEKSGRERRGRRRAGRGGRENGSKMADLASELHYVKSDVSHFVSVGLERRLERAQKIYTR